MRSDILQQLEAEYAERRRTNEREEDRRKKLILETVPEAADLIKERERAFRSVLRSIASGKPDSSADSLQEKVKDYSARIGKALEKNGYPADYLEPVYTCSVCRDTGYTGETLKSPCDCFRRAYQSRLRKIMGLDQRAEESFGSFREDVYSDEIIPELGRSARAQMKRVKAVCEKWADTYPDSEIRDLLLTGKSGLGKTFLMRAMASRLIERDVPVLLISAYQFFESARAYLFENDDSFSELTDACVLMIDDIGSEPLMNRITVEQLFYLTDRRQRENKATVLSTNLNLSEFRNRYTERTASRLTDTRHCIVLPLAGSDLRETLAMEQRLK